MSSHHSVPDLTSDHIMSDCDCWGIIFASDIHLKQHKEQGCRKRTRYNSDSETDTDSDDGFEFLLEYIREENQDEFDDSYKHTGKNQTSPKREPWRKQKEIY